MAGPSVTAFDVAYAGFPIGLLAVAIFTYPRLPFDEFAPRVESDSLAAVVIGVAATLLGVPLALGLATFGAGNWTPLLAIGFGVLGTALGARYPATTTTERLVTGGVLGLVAFTASNTLVAATTTTTVTTALTQSIIAALLALPATELIPLGHADTATPSLATPLRALIVAASLTAAVLIATSVPPGPGRLFSVWLYNAIFAGVVALIGPLPYWVGWELGRARS